MSERASYHAPETVREKQRPSQTANPEVVTPEPLEDLHTKEVFKAYAPAIRTVLKDDIAKFELLVKELREKELTRTNFVSAENMWGVSTIVRGDGNTFSGERLDSIEGVLEKEKLREGGLTRMTSMIDLGARLRAIAKDPRVYAFLISPEGNLLVGISEGKKDLQTLHSEFILAKAREFKGSIIRGEEFSEPYYEALLGTPLESIAKNEKMTFGDKAYSKFHEFGNTMVGLDSVATMVAGAGAGKVLGTLVARSDSLRNGSLASLTALNTSAARFAVPGMNVLVQAGNEGKMLSLAKGGVNFIAEIAKGFGYTEIARAVGGEDAAKAISYPLMLIPGLKGQFEASMKVSLSSNPENFALFSRWLTKNYDKTKLEKMMLEGYKERLARENPFGRNVNDFAKDPIGEIKGVLDTLFKSGSPSVVSSLAEKTGNALSETGSKTMANKSGSAIAEGIGNKAADAEARLASTGANQPQVNKNTSPAKDIPKPTEPEIPTKQPEKTDAPHTNSGPIEKKAGEAPPIHTEAEFENFLKTTFLEHGDLTLKNANPVVQNLLYKWRDYELLAVKNPVEGERLKAALVSYVDGMRTTANLMEGIDNWALMSSNSFFLAKKDFRYIPDDFDISIDRKDFETIKKKLIEAWQSGKITEPKPRAISDPDHRYSVEIDGKWKARDLTPDEIPLLLQEGNFKLLFNLKTKTGKPIETEFFVEDAGKGLTQIGHMDRTIESVRIKGKEVKYLSEKDAVEGNVLNLLDEGRRNGVEVFSKKLREALAKEGNVFEAPKAKDGTRLMNLLVHADEKGPRGVSALMRQIDEIVEKYRVSGKELSPALASIVEKKNVDAVKTELKNMNDLHKRLPEGTINDPINFEQFRSELAKEKLEITKMYLKIKDGIASEAEKVQFSKELVTMNESIRDRLDLYGGTKNFPYYYELSKLSNSFIRPTLDKLPKHP